MVVTLTSGAVLVDADNDGTPDILHFTDANGNTTTYTCIDDLNGDCIPDCFEQFIPRLYRYNIYLRQ